MIGALTTLLYGVLSLILLAVMIPLCILFIAIFLQNGKMLLFLTSIVALFTGAFTLAIIFFLLAVFWPWTSPASPASPEEPQPAGPRRVLRE